MSRIVRLVEVRKAIFGFTLVLFSVVGLQAYDAVRFNNCSASCGPCSVWVTGCISCEAGGDGDGCYAQGEGCSSSGCSCNSDPNWECTYYEN